MAIYRQCQPGTTRHDNSTGCCCCDSETGQTAPKRLMPAHIRAESVPGEDVYYARANKGLASVGAQIAQGGGLFRQEESHSLCGIRVGTMTIDFGMPPQLTITNVKNLPKTQVTHKIWNFHSVPVLSERKAGYVRNVIMWQRDRQKI